MTPPTCTRRATVLLSAVVAGCGATSDDASTATLAAQIIDGETCGDAGWWQSAVALLAEVEHGHGADARVTRRVICSGVMVAPDLALSAAHCVRPALFAPDLIDVTSVSYWVSNEPDLGGWTVTSPLPSDATAVLHFETHPDFVPDVFDGGADLALLELSGPRDQPVAAIPSRSNDGLTAGVRVHGVGWGLSVVPPLLGDPPPEASGVRRCGSTVLDEVDASELRVGSCATRKCYGDSGGPTFAEFESATVRHFLLVSIASRDHESGGCARGGIETRVDTYAPWLLERGARPTDADPTTLVFAPAEPAECIQNEPEIRIVSPPPERGGCAAAVPLPLVWLLVVGGGRRLG